MTSSVAIFGSLAIDDLVFSDGTTRWAVPGGSAAYAALGASLWTEHVNIVAPIGADYPKDLLEGRFDLLRCPAVPHALRNWGLYEEDGIRHFISRKKSRNWSEFCPQPKDVRSGSQTAAHIGPMPQCIAAALCEELRNAGRLSISLDLDDHDLIGNLDQDVTMHLIRNCDLFLPSLQDAQALSPGATAPEILHGLRSALPDLALIAVKCGVHGVIGHAADAHEWIHVPAVPVVVTDATGAGDAFCGGALAGFERRQDPIEALLLGTVSASFCVEGLGLSGIIGATEAKAYARLSALRERVVRHPM